MSLPKLVVPKTPFEIPKFLLKTQLWVIYTQTWMQIGDSVQQRLKIEKKRFGCILTIIKTEASVSEVHFKVDSHSDKTRCHLSKAQEPAAVPI